MRIPKSVESALVKQRKEMNKTAERVNNHSSDSSMRTQPEHLEKELFFWQIDDDEILDDFILEELPYALMLAPDSFNWDDLPAGYAPLVRVMDFELCCQSEGWNAVGNISEIEMSDVIASYKFFGLQDEARALASVLAKHKEGIDENSDQYHTEMGKAYKSVSNLTPELEDRLTCVREFVRNNCELFGVE